MCDSINDRISFIIEDLGYSKADFAKQLSLTPQYIYKLCKVGVPSDRTIQQICKIFGVNEQWIRFGTGKPYKNSGREEELSRIFKEASDNDSIVKRRFITALARLPDSAFPIIERLILEVANDIEDEKKSGN